MLKQNFLYKMYCIAAKMLLLADVDEYSFANADPSYSGKASKCHGDYYLNMPQLWGFGCRWSRDFLVCSMKTNNIQTVYICYIFCYSGRGGKCHGDYYIGDYYLNMPQLGGFGVGGTRTLSLFSEDKLHTDLLQLLHFVSWTFLYIRCKLTIICNDYNFVIIGGTADWWYDNLWCNSRDPAARCWQRGSSSFHRKNDR